jgi:hypothetical protein
MWDDNRTLEEQRAINRMVDVAYGNRCRHIRTSIQYEEKMAKLYDAGYRNVFDTDNQPQDIKVRIKHYVDGYEELVDLHNLALWSQTEQTTNKPIFQVIGVLIGEKYISLQEKLK